MIKIKPAHNTTCTCSECVPNNKKVMVPIDMSTLSENDRKIIEDYLAKQQNSVPSVKDNNVPDFPKPAMRFDGFNIYTHNGVVTVPATIYNTLADLGIKITDLLLQDTNSDTLKFDMYTLGKIVSTNMCMCIDNFILTLDNVYSIHVDKMNDSFKEILTFILGNLSAEEDYKNHEYISRFRFSPSFHFINRENLARAIITYISIGPEARVNMYNNIMSFAMSYINNAGISIYNGFRNEITTLCEEEIVTKNSPDIVKTMFKFIDSEFSFMMSDFTFEAGVFANNIIENFDILFNPANFLPKNLNIEVPNFTYQNNIQ